MNILLVTKIVGVSMSPCGNFLIQLVAFLREQKIFTDKLNIKILGVLVEVQTFVADFGVFYFT